MKTLKKKNLSIFIEINKIWGIDKEGNHADMQEKTNFHKIVDPRAWYNNKHK